MSNARFCVSAVLASVAARESDSGATQFSEWSSRRIVAAGVDYFCVQNRTLIRGTLVELFGAERSRLRAVGTPMVAPQDRFGGRPRAGDTSHAGLLAFGAVISHSPDSYAAVRA